MSSDSVAELLDLPDELLSQCAAQCATVASTSRDAATTLCRLAVTCHTFLRLVISDVEAAALAWSGVLRLLGSPVQKQPSPQLYRSLSNVDRIWWDEWLLRAPPSCKQSLRGRSSSASCCLNGALLMYGGTLNGNMGPLLDDLLILHVDTINEELTVKHAREPAEGRGTADPSFRRGHTMTVTRLTSGEEVACVLGGWGHDEIPMQPYLLRQDADGVYRWECPVVSGDLPPGRAFHSATEVAPGRLLVYGGLGQGCCRVDLALLDLHAMAWSAPTLSGAPRCLGGRAGHGAAFFGRPTASAKERGSGSGGELLLVSGAMRSASGDVHQGSVDVIEITPDDCEPAGLRLAWSDDEDWARVMMPAVRTAWYTPVARSLVAWSGVSEHHGLIYTLHVIDVERRHVRELDAGHLGQSSAELPTPRGGALGFPLPLGTTGSVAALLLCGSDHEDGDEVLDPWLMTLRLSH